MHFIKNANYIIITYIKQGFNGCHWSHILKDVLAYISCDIHKQLTQLINTLISIIRPLSVIIYKIWHLESMSSIN